MVWLIAGGTDTTGGPFSFYSYDNGTATAIGSPFSFYCYDNGTTTTNSPMYYPYLDEGTAYIGSRFETRSVEPRFIIKGPVHVIPDVIDIRPIPDPKPDPPDPAREIERIEREISAQRARALLLEHLDEDNKKRYIEKKPIEIASKIFNDIKYRIPISKTDRIQALKENNIIDKLCITVKEPEYLPLEDVVLTKLLHALFNEEEMIRTANHYPRDKNLLTMLN